MDWSQEIVFEFLVLYENEPVIWQPNHPKHKNRNLINDAWLHIKNKISIECTVAELKRKKESLMSIFRPLLKKVKASSKTAWIVPAVLGKYANAGVFGKYTSSGSPP